MNKQEALKALGIPEKATREDIQSFFIEKQKRLEQLIAETEDEAFLIAYQQELAGYQDASALLLQITDEEDNQGSDPEVGSVVKLNLVPASRSDLGTEAEPASANDVRAAIVAKMSGKPVEQIPEEIVDSIADEAELPTETIDIVHSKPKSRSWVGASVVILLIIAIGAIGAFYVTNKDSLNLFKTEESILETAAVEKIRGEIESYQQRLDKARNDIANEIKSVELNNEVTDNVFYTWHKLISKVLLNSDAITELKGEVRMGESLFQQQSLTHASTIFTSVRDKYRAIWEQYTAAADIPVITVKVNEGEATWSTLQLEYKINGPVEVSIADTKMLAANEAIDAGDFIKAKQFLESAAQNWQLANQSVAKQVALIKQEREQALLDAIEAEKKRLADEEAKRLEIAAASEAEKKRLIAIEEQKAKAALALKQAKEAEAKKLAAIEAVKAKLATKPNPIKVVQPSYPRQALLSKKEGWVDFKFTIDEEGTPIDIELVESSPRNVFDRAAFQAFRKWKFEPVKIDGKVVVQKNVGYRIQFKLD